MLTRIVLVLLVLGGAACSRTIDTGIHDAAVTAAVKTALLNDPAIDGTLVTVRAEGGVIYLGGTQPSPECASQVVSLVRGVEGVRDVQSSITISTSPPEIAAERNNVH